MSLSKTVFPPPPPTKNELTLHQRKQLLRSTRKLGKLLGTTPRVVDVNEPCSPITLDLPLSPGAFDPSRKFMFSNDSSSSLSSPTSSCSSSSPTSSRPFFPPSSMDTRPASPVVGDSPYQYEELWPALKQPPLHISLPKSLGRSSGSLRRSSTSGSNKSRGHSRSQSVDGFKEGADTHLTPVYTFTPQTDAPIRDSVNFSPDFQVPTTSTMRRQKMDKLRRTLGEPVPYHLVFPSEDGDDNENSSEDDDRSIEKAAVVVEKHAASPRAGSPSMEVKISRPYRIRRVPVPKWEPEAEEDVPSLLRVKALSIIIESPGA